METTTKTGDARRRWWRGRETLRGSLHEREDREDFLSGDGAERMIDEAEAAIVMEMFAFRISLPFVQVSGNVRRRKGGMGVIYSGVA